MLQLVNNRPKETFHQCVRDMETDSFVGTSTTTKIQCWKDVVGGKSRGGVYCIGDLAANIHHGVSFLAQLSILVRTIHPRSGQLVETKRLLEEVKQANMRDDKLIKNILMFKNN